MQPTLARRAITGLAACGTAIVCAGLAAAVVAPPVAAHGSVPDAPPSIASIVLGWSFEPAVALPLLVAAIAWWRLTGSVNRVHPDHPVPRSQRWSFLAGLGVIAIALESGLARYDDTLFSVHMVQHVLLVLVAPPLLALAAPITQVLRAAPGDVRTRLLIPILQSRAVRIAGHPLVTWLVFAAVMWGTHFTVLFDRALEDRLVHDLEHALYLGAGLLFWWPVVARDPAPHRMSFPARIGYTFLQMPQNSFLGMAILFAEHPLYAHYATLGSPYGIDALADQRLAGGIMWFLGDIVFLVATLAILAGWMRSEERGAAAAERRADVERAAIRERAAALDRRRSATVTPDQSGGASSSER